MRRRFALLVPHIRRALLIGKVIDLKTVEAAALTDSLDTLSAGMFLVDATGRITPEISFLDKRLFVPAQDGRPLGGQITSRITPVALFLVSPWRNTMRRFTWAAAAAATVAIILSAPGSQPAALAASLVKTPLVAARVVCPRLVRPTCPKYYTAACIQHGRGAAFRCCAKMGCVPQPH